MKDINFEIIGRRLREARIAKGLTQEYVANMVDVNTSHISNIENNRVKISLSTLIKVCDTLGTTVDYILANEYTDSLSVLDQEIIRALSHCDMEKKEKILKIIQIL